MAAAEAEVHERRTRQVREAGVDREQRRGYRLIFRVTWQGVAAGRVAANVVGGYLIGVAVEVFLHRESIPPEWRLFVIVGFLGGLTTFSSFSAEAVELLRDNDFGWALTLVSVHLLGSLTMTYLGV